MTEPTIKDRPILFSGPMVKAIFEGRKTQTRRIVKPQPIFDGKRVSFTWKGWAYPLPLSKTHPCDQWFSRECPYGQPGDRLWVREKAKLQSCGTREKGETAWASLFYDADKAMSERIVPGYTHKPYLFTQWTPSIHMPRWASRITLEIVSVRVERLNDISEEDSQAEGIPFNGTYWLGGHHPVKGSLQCWNTAKDAFRKTWDVINGSGSWEKNSWVWVIEFKRVTPGELCSICRLVHGNEIRHECE